MSRGATARLFVAIDPPPEVCEELSNWARRAAGGLISAAERAPRVERGKKASPHRPRGRPRARVLPAESLHLTLCFLGNRPVAELAALGGALEECTGEVGELSIGAPVWLPQRRPQVLAVEVHDEDGLLARLQQTVAQALAGASGWEPERRRFRAHITLVRTHMGAPPPYGESSLPATPRVRFTPQALVLYRSLLAPGGASYEALLSRELTGDR